MTQRPHDQPPLPTEEIIRRLEAKPYSRTCREAARRLRELTAPSRPTPPG